MFKWLEKLFYPGTTHTCTWVEVHRREVPLLQANYMWGITSHILGQLVIEKCSGCGEFRAFFMSEDIKQKVDVKFEAFHFGIDLSKL